MSARAPAHTTQQCGYATRTRSHLAPPHSDPPKNGTLSSSSSSSLTSPTPVAPGGGAASMTTSAASSSYAVTPAANRADLQPPEDSRAGHEARQRGSGSTATAAGASSGSGGGLHLKQKRTPKEIKVKKRAPWGAQQLRDSWSEDAMTKMQKENMSERVHREYRYHPEEFRRYYIRLTGLLALPCIAVGGCMGYYYHTGQAIWHGDPQHLLNLVRALDTSPRSQLYLYKLDETRELPPHVRAYREAHQGERDLRERVFRATNSAFTLVDADLLRRLKAEEEAAGAAGEDEDEGEDNGNAEMGGGDVDTAAAAEKLHQLQEEE